MEVDGYIDYELINEFSEDCHQENEKWEDLKLIEERTTVIDTAHNNEKDPGKKEQLKLLLGRCTMRIKEMLMRQAEEVN